MPAKVPDPYVWNADFQVFYKQLDDEHKGLFQGIFNCNAARSDAAALDSLRAVVTKHFRNEEGAMDSASYECKDHKAKHKAFEGELAKLGGKITDDQIKYAMEWLVNHISETDFKYKGKLKLAA